MLNVIKTDFQKHFDHKLIEELLEAYQESKRNFLVGGLRLSAVEGGRFCEAVFRVLEQATTSAFTPLGRQIDADKIIVQLTNLPRTTHSDSIRLHIPRALRVVYDIRNNRDAAHLADGIDPNLQDATLVISIIDWILAELVRLYHGCSPDQAQDIIESLVTRKVPAVQDFNGFLKVLRPKLKVGEYTLLLLYERGEAGATYLEIENWIKPTMRRNLQRTLYRLVHETASIHFDDDKYFITKLGMTEVEIKKFHQL